MIFSDSLSTFIGVWFCRSSMRCQRCTTQTTHCDREPRCLQTTRRIYWRQPLELKQLQSWRSSSFFVRCDFLLQLQFWSHHLPRSATYTSPVRRFPSITQCLSCPTIASRNSVLGNAQNCSRSIIMTDKDSLSHAACKRTDTKFSYFTEPNFLSKLRHWHSASSSSSSQFARLCLFQLKS